MWLLLKYTTLGYEARAVGFNPWASETGGISVQATIVKSLCISGALAGIAGVIEVIAVQDGCSTSSRPASDSPASPSRLLAKNNPLGVIAAAILFGALSAGSGTMQLEAEVPQNVIFIIQALIIFFVAADALAKWVVRPFSKEATQSA